MSTFTTRFAPSPTGHLHLGHAYSAMKTFETARAAGGQCLLRIEDIDTTRCKPEFEDQILADLKWLGFDWPTPIRRQSEHLDGYAAVINALAERGLVYRCFKTRKEIAKDIARAPHAPGEGPEGLIYPGPETPMSTDEEDERLRNGESFSWRLAIKACRDELGDAFNALMFIEEGRGPDGETGLVIAKPDLLGDVILARKDIGTSYHIAACHDDALQGMTHVIRGEDLFFTTHLHVLLQKLMGWPKPIYRHHRLVRDQGGKRFAKRDKSMTLKALREQGFTPDQLKDMAGF
jgi:glutamyl-Q tRNA(Asp) synthetase